ncbi:MAG: restriction endonuclease subunit S [Gillisia sp.]
METEILELQKTITSLRFNSFKDNWIKNGLGHVCIKIQDGNYGASYPKAEEFVEKGIPFLTSKAIGGDGVLIKEKIDFIPLSKHQSLKKAHLKLNDVLFTNRGANVGTVGFVTAEISHGNIGPQLTLLRADLNQISPLFLRFLMISPSFQKQLKAQDSGSAMNFFGIGTTSKFKIFTPSLPEQQKIASFLSAVDKKIQQLTRKKELLESYKKGVMQQLFSQEIRFKDEVGNNFPEWEEKKLGELATFSKGKGISKDDILEDGLNPCIRYGQLYTTYKETIEHTISKTNVPKKKLVLSEAGDVIIPASGETQIDIATASCVLKEGIALGGDLNIIRGSFNGVFLAYYLNAHLKTDIARLSQGSSVIHLYATQLKNLKLEIPAIEEQQKIAEFLSAIDKKIEAVSQQIEKTHSFKKGLLQQMFI